MKAQPTWQKLLRMAEGYLGLGMLEDAAQMLDEIPSEDRTRPEVLGARVDFYSAAKNWDMAAAISEHMVKTVPEEPGWWISYAYATRRAENVECAEGILLRAAEVHPGEMLIQYNLACYASVMGRLDLARRRLGRAIEINAVARELAKDDEDLKPLWPEIR